jgi:hypothetical protein
MSLMEDLSQSVSYSDNVLKEENDHPVDGNNEMADGNSGHVNSGNVNSGNANKQVSIGVFIYYTH